MSMLYIRETKGTVEAIGAKLEEAVKARKFGVIAVVDLQAKMKEKGVEFQSACRIYEVCNPHKAKQVLERDMTISTALPCRISVYEEGEMIKLATLRPTQVLSLYGSPGLDAVAQEVERDIVAMIDAAVS